MAADSDPQRRAEYDGPRRQWPGSGFSGFESGLAGGLDLEDLFNGIFGRLSPRRGADQEAEFEVSLDEAYQGGRRRFTLDGRRLEVRIPQGVIDGQRIRLAGQGGRGRGEGPRGDLFLVVHVIPPDRYRLRGRDVIVDLPVAPWEAALGAQVPLVAPAGELKVQVPAGSSSGRRLRLRGQGIPHPSGTPGDLFAEVEIAVPHHAGDRERELFEELAKVSTFDPRTEARRR